MDLKDSRIIFPKRWDNIGLNYLPSRNDRHIVSLHIPYHMPECKFGILDLFYDTNNELYLVMDNVAYGQNGECWNRVIIHAKFTLPPSISVNMNLKQRAIEDEEA